jgi:hypothetical protein
VRSRLRLAVVVCAIIWAAVIIASAMVMEGTPGFSRLLSILGGGAAATIILLGGLMAQEKKEQ